MIGETERVCTHTHYGVNLLTAPPCYLRVEGRGSFEAFLVPCPNNTVRWAILCRFFVLAAVHLRPISPYQAGGWSHPRDDPVPLLCARRCWLSRKLFAFKMWMLDVFFLGNLKEIWGFSLVYFFLKTFLFEFFDKESHKNTINIKIKCITII